MILRVTFLIQPTERRKNMKFDLDCKQHCIETAIKRRCNAAITAYFRRDANRDLLEMEIALLQKALQEFDFNALRSRWPFLSGGLGCRATLGLDYTGLPLLLVEGLRIVPPANQKK